MQKESSSQATLSDFAQLIANMSRFISGLAMIPPFAAAEIGLSEWLVLAALSQNEGISNNQLAKSLGVSGQRINQIVTSLSRLEFISIRPSQTDSRKNEIRMSQTGRARLESFNRSLEPVVAEAFRGRGNQLTRLDKQARYLARFVATAKSTARRQPTAP